MFDTTGPEPPTRRPTRTEIIGAAGSKDLTVKATVKSELQITGVADDDFLDTLIHQASAQIVSYCGREFARETIRDTFRISRGYGWLQLSRWPTASITSITESGVALAASDYELDAAAGRLLRVSSGAPILWTDELIVVTHVSGWNLLAELPHDLERACIDLVKSRYRQRLRDQTIKAERVDGVASFEYWVGDIPGEDAGLPSQVAGVLDQYREARI